MPRTSRIATRFCWIAAALLSVSSALAQSTALKKAVPVDPIAAILEAFRSHPIVALAEGSHNNEQGHAFRLALIRDPRFAATVDDIVVEAGNALHQDVMDRFVRGDDVPYDVLRRVWQDTTQPDALWDSPIYEEFYRAVRTLNTTHPKERQLRILLGDPPVDWNTIRNREDWMRYLLLQNEYPTDLIRREVLAKGRRALIIFGGNHLTRRNPLGGRTIVSRFESDTPGAVFSIWTALQANLETMQSDVPSWPKPSLVLLRGTELGAKSVRSFPPAGGGESVRMEDQFDAILYVGLSTTFSRARRTLCGDHDYVEMRLKRFALIGDPQTKEQFCAGLENSKSR